LPSLILESFSTFLDSNSIEVILSGIEQMLLYTEAWSASTKTTNYICVIVATIATWDQAGNGRTVTMSPNVTINATSSQPEAIASSVRQAIRDPLREGLDQLKKMRNYEARLGYV
jgi:hypothetical protein